MQTAKCVNKWTELFRENKNADLRLFCFPYAGGSSAIFRLWPPELPPAVELFGVQLPGRGHRVPEPLRTNVRELADEIAEHLSPLFCEMPFVFFGHSMGATLAFEVAIRIAKNPEAKPALIIASGRQAPHILDRDAPTYNLPDEQIINELKRLNGTPKEILECEEMMKLMVPVIRADFEAIQTYRYVASPRLECPLVIFGGVADVDIPREDLEGWATHTSSTCTIRMFPGNHFFLHSCEALVLQALSRELNCSLETLSSSLPCKR